MNSLLLSFDSLTPPEDVSRVCQAIEDTGAPVARLDGRIVVTAPLEVIDRAHRAAIACLYALGHSREHTPRRNER